MNSQLTTALRRKRRKSELGSVWLALGLTTGGLLCALGVAISRGWFLPGDESYRGILRGYTQLGLGLGMLSVLLSSLALLYIFRKRTLQETIFAKASMMTWLWLHIAVGGLAYLAALLHAGRGLLDARITSGDFAFWGCTLVILSGVVWRLMYWIVPASVISTIGNYSQKTSSARAQQQRRELEKLAAGGSPTLHEAKEWLLSADRSDSDYQLREATKQLETAEAQVFAQMVPLSASLHRATRRQELQGNASRRLQGWRVLHVPLSLLVVLAVAWHLSDVYRLPSRIASRFLAPGQVERLPGLSTGHHLSSACADCHTEIYEQWTTSMHAHAASSPVTIVQSNQVARGSLKDAKGPDPARICTQCHSPIGSLLTKGNTFPLGKTALENQGVGCTTCHQFAGKAVSAGGGVADGLMAGIEPGSVMLGRSRANVGNAYHQTKPSPTLSKDPTDLCQSCHNVHVDRDGSGDIDRGHDLVLQMTHQEYTRYRASGGVSTCMDCHMPLVQTDQGPLQRTASGAAIPWSQDKPAPPRQVRSHRFVGVDYPLNERGQDEANARIRHSLLRSAALLRIEGAEVSKQEDGNSLLKVSASITNVGAGHDLPTGFAFARQMWLEVVVREKGGKKALFSSGVLPSNISDLCDHNTMADANEKLRPHILNCEVPDPQLVNFQKKLVTKTVPHTDEDGNLIKNSAGDHSAVQAEDGFETPLQHLTGGAVLRTRPSDRQVLAPIPPLESRTFIYSAEVPKGVTLEVSVRLLFRHLPAYFLRQLAAGQPQDEQPRLAPLIDNLEVVEMAKESQVIEAAK